MLSSELSGPVVIGIDGSQAAINAALWAATEALHRDVPLRLIHVVPTDGGQQEANGSVPLELESAAAALRAVTAAVESAGQPVKIETDIVRGHAGPALVEESRTAAMLCVGSTGIGAVSSRVLGSTATAVAHQARCTVAVIRTPHSEPLSGTDWIVLAVDECAVDDAVVDFAMTEAALRRAPILAVGVWSADFGETMYDELDRRVQTWRDANPGLHIYPVTTRAKVSRFLGENTDISVQLAVIAERDAHELADIIGPHRHSVISHGYCSVVVAR